MPQPQDSQRPEADISSVAPELAITGRFEGNRTSFDESWLPPPRDGRSRAEDDLAGRFGWRRSPSPDGSSCSPPPGIDQIGAETDGTNTDEPPPEIPGFAILGECGRGGMGVVYVAEQLDLKRRVAVKFLHPELAVAQSQRTRLATEARALARLQHPNIVQIFSSGTHNGRSFIVQEYIGGENLQKTLSRHPLPGDAAARLVAALARAVQHAHDHRIIHRDLKPSNVLFTVDGTPKISDFGLAKHADLGADSSQTKTGTILGSPSYMSPEQSLGKTTSIGPATDIYSLGAILYELLTGRPPFLSASAIETLEQVHSADPVSPRRLQPRVPRDLATICLKCLSKDPAHRYATAAALADDLDRFVDARPILARPPSSAECLAKWIKRQPATAASLGVALVAALALLFGGLIYQGLLRAALKQARENELLARDQQRESDSRYRLARETLSKMLDHFQSRDLRQVPRLKELQRKQLTDALGFYREVIRDRANPNASVRFNAALASLHAGQAQFLLGRYTEGRDQVNLAISLLKHLVSEDPTNAEYRLTLAQCYRYRSYSDSGESTASVPESSESSRFLDLEKASELLNALIEHAPENRSYRTELALTYNTLGSYWSGRKRLDMAEAAYRHAVEWYGRALERSPSSATDDPGLRVRKAESLLSLAVILQQTDHKNEVLPLYAESRQVIEDALRQDPTWDEAKVSLGWTLLNWGVCLTYNPAARAKAESLINEAIDIFSPIVNHEPDWDLARRGLHNGLGALAQMRMEQGRFGESARLLEESLRVCAPDQKEHVQFFLAMALAKANEHRKAWGLIQTLRPGLSKRPTDYHVHLATVCSFCIKAAENDTAISTADRARICSDYGSAGVELLREALSITPESQRDELLRAQCEEPDMAPLRRQTGFPSILAGSPATKNANPRAARAPAGNR